MEFNIIKESCIEYCENIYALSVNYLRNNNNVELVNLMNELTMLEDDIRMCNNLEFLNSYRVLLECLVNKIEGIINE